jgi:dethiobiotin synthetase/adenosylmethionine--8-amino-7-oxononanoate aminotransferase
MLTISHSDPLFQRCLTDVVRDHPELFSPNASSPKSAPSWSGLPVIFDEVFTGLYRLGRPSSASFLDVHPDIAVNAKLLTGGLIPLCTTVASQEIFDTFSSPEKSDALLHGHSYTAHAVGCTVAVDSLRTMDDMDKNGSWDGFKADWDSKSANSTGSGSSDVWSVWSQSLLQDLSRAEAVESVFGIGTVLSVSLRDAQGGGKHNSFDYPSKRSLTNEQVIHPRLQRAFSRSWRLVEINSTSIHGFWVMFST